MTHLEAFGAIALTLVAAVFGLCCVVWQAGKRYGVEEYLCEKQSLRSQRRKEARTAPGRHRLSAFPGDDELFERKPADTGELRALSAMAEDGELDRIKAENAAFFRTWDLRQWTRKWESAA